jgi:hypothetical protein
MGSGVNGKDTLTKFAECKSRRRVKKKRLSYNRLER